MFHPLRSSHSSTFELTGLEPRRLFAVTLQDGVLSVTGTAGHDWVQIYTPVETPGKVNVLTFRQRIFETGPNQLIRASRSIARFNLADVQSIRVETRAGHDGVFLDPLAKEVPAWISTGADQDLVRGSTGLTRVYLGDGNDFLSMSKYGSRGRFIAFGQGGDDQLSGGNSNDVLDGGDGFDWLSGLRGKDVLRGGADDDRLWGAHDNDTLHGGDGDDTINGGSGVDQLFGDAGADDLDGGSGGDLLMGGSGNDDLFGDDVGDILDDADAGDNGPNPT